jgi:hypothetical protein
LKDLEGNWDLRPHSSRITTVSDATLATWHAVLENVEVPIGRTRMVYAVNRSTAAVLDKLSRSRRMSELPLEFSRGWDESIDRKKGYFESAWGTPDSWNDAILQGPHLFVATPLYKTPNKTMLHNQDWSAVDFEALGADTVPITAYKPTGDRYIYDCAYTEWGSADDPRPARDYYRVAWRNMAANTGERTLIPAVIPPGTAHVDGVYSGGFADELQASRLLLVAGFLSSIVTDFSVRTTPKSNIRANVINRLAILEGHPLESELILRAARLNCVTDAYAQLWSGAWRAEMSSARWSAVGRPARPVLADVTDEWCPNVPLRVAVDRRQALVEVDALVAFMLGLTAQELCTIYRTQFAVLNGYDRKVYYFDKNGRLVPNSVLVVWRKKGDRISEDERTATNQAGNTYTYELPFVTLDREADMRQAYAHFEQLLKDRS